MVKRKRKKLRQYRDAELLVAHTALEPEALNYSLNDILIASANRALSLKRRDLAAEIASNGSHMYWIISGLVGPRYKSIEQCVLFRNELERVYHEH